MFIVGGLWLPDRDELISRLDGIIVEALSGQPSVILKLLGLYTEPSFIEFLFYIAVCFAVYFWGKQFHRRFQLPRMSSGLESRGWRIEPRTDEKDPLLLLRTEYASAPRRIVGKVIDVVPFLALVMATLFASTEIIPYEYFEAVLLAWLVSMLALAWLYSTLLLVSRHQATLGMRAAGVFRTDLRGERLTFGRASALFGLRLLSYLFYGLGFFLQPFTVRRQTFHDMMARSVVLRGRLPKAPASDAGQEGKAGDQEQAASASPGLRATV